MDVHNALRYKWHSVCLPSMLKVFYEILKFDCYAISNNNKPHFTSTLVVTSRESNACSVFASQACLCAIHVYVSPSPGDPLNAKDTYTGKNNFMWRHYHNANEIRCIEKRHIRRYRFLKPWSQTDTCARRFGFVHPLRLLGATEAVGSRTKGRTARATHFHRAQFWTLSDRTFRQDV